MRGMFEEDTYKHSPAIILHDEILKGLVGGGCSKVEDGIGGILCKCYLHDDIGLSVFVM